MKWFVCECWTLSYSLLGNWLRDHTFWALGEIGVKIKSVPKYFWSSILNFTAPRYAFLFLNSEIYIVHVINCEWSRSVNFPLRMFCMWYKHVFFPTLVMPLLFAICQQGKNIYKHKFICNVLFFLYFKWELNLQSLLSLLPP